MEKVKFRSPQIISWYAVLCVAVVVVVVVAAAAVSKCER